MVLMQTYIKTYGCTLNQADTNIISSVLSKGGIRLSDEAEADVLIVNTCTVKSSAERRIIDYIRGLEADHRRIIVTGCLAGANSDIISRYAPTASIVTTPNIDRMPEAVSRTARGERVVFGDYRRSDRLSILDGSSFGECIAKVQISDGCLSSCGFCETRFARGPLNSFSDRLILRAIEMAVERGAKEIQLTSQDVGAYGLDRGTDIAELMGRIMEIDGDFKVRIGMLNPDHLWRYIERFATYLRDERFYRFVHLPVQSGSDRVLRAMGRNYSVERIYEHLDYLRSEVDGLTFMTDIIVGYPSENDIEFDETLDFIREARPDTVNLSKFTKRPHARASKMIQIPDGEIKRRSRIAASVIRDVQHDVNESFVGKEYRVLATEATPGSINGRTDSYKQVILNRNLDIEMGRYYNVRILDKSANVLYGRVI